MENASKALLIAGSILIALITIAVLVRSFANISEFQMSQLSEEEQEKLIAFNEQYTKYLNKYVYGTEVITALNRSLDNTQYKITAKVKFTNNYTYRGYKEHTTADGRKYWQEEDIHIDKGDAWTITNTDAEGISTAISAINDLTSAGAINTMAFKCTSIGYDSYGRVNSITFEEKKWGDLY